MALTYQGFVGSTSGGPDATYSSLPIGTASADRWAIFGIMAVRFSSTSETVSLSSGDTAVQTGTMFTSGGRNVVFYRANITAGTTVDLTLTGNAGASSFFETGVAVWTEDAGEPILFDQDGVAKPSFGADMVASVDVDASGIVIAMATHGFNSGGGTYTGLTEDFDLTSPTNISGASDDGLSSETGRTITLAVAGGEFENLIKVISLSPPAAGGVSVAFDLGTFTQTGNDLTVTTNTLVALDAGSYSLAGQDFAVTQNLVVPLDAGAFNQTGRDLAITNQFPVALDAGSYALTGRDFSISTGVSISLESGEYVLAGNDFALSTALILNLDAGTYSLVGRDLTILDTTLVSLDSGSYVFAGADLEVAQALSVSLDRGTYSLTGNALTILAEGSSQARRATANSSTNSLSITASRNQSTSTDSRNRTELR